MAIYVPDSTRRNRLVAFVAIALVVGLALGFVLGRGTAEGIDDAVDAVNDQAEGAAVALQRIPIEYEQASAGSGGESTDTITQAIESAREELFEAFADADWFGPRPAEDLNDLFEKLLAGVRDGVAPPSFEMDVRATVEAIEAVFGVDASGSG